MTLMIDMSLSRKKQNMLRKGRKKAVGYDHTAVILKE